MAKRKYFLKPINCVGLFLHDDFLVSEEPDELFSCKNRVKFTGIHTIELEIVAKIQICLIFKNPMAESDYPYYYGDWHNKLDSINHSHPNISWLGDGDMV